MFLKTQCRIKAHGVNIVAAFDGCCLNRNGSNAQLFVFKVGSRIWQSDAKSHRILIVAKNRRRLGPINLKLTVLGSVWIKEPIPSTFT